eukprot:Skav219880  [mRNA]  locus=scaffold777:323461:334394:+ [translate_table: standard]
MTAQVDGILSKRQNGVSCVEDFAVERVCAALNKLRQPAKGKTEKDQAPLVRSSIAREQHRCGVLQELIKEASASLETAQETRTKLEKQLKASSGPSLNGSPTARSEVNDSQLQDIEAEITATQDEVQKIEGEIAALVTQRELVERLLAEDERQRAPAKDKSFVSGSLESTLEDFGPEDEETAARMAKEFERYESYNETAFEGHALDEVLVKSSSAMALLPARHKAMQLECLMPSRSASPF